MNTIDHFTIAMHIGKHETLIQGQSQEMVKMMTMIQTLQDTQSQSATLIEQPKGKTRELESQTQDEQTQKVDEDAKHIQRIQQLERLL